MLMLQVSISGSWRIRRYSKSIIWFRPRILASSSSPFGCNVLLVSWKIVHKFTTLHPSWCRRYFCRHERDSPHSEWCWGNHQYKLCLHINSLKVLCFRVSLKPKKGFRIPSLVSDLTWGSLVNITTTALKRKTKETTTFYVIFIK